MESIFYNLITGGAICSGLSDIDYCTGDSEVVAALPSSLAGASILSEGLPSKS